MRRIAGLLAFLCVGLFFNAYSANAQAPAGVFGFQDGKFYDQNQTLKYLCFQDGNCYDMSQKFAFKQEVKGAATTTVEFIAPVLPQPMDNGTVRCQIGGTGSHNMGLYCTNTRKTDVIARKLTISLRGSGATRLHVLTFGDKIGVQDFTAVSKQVLVIDLNTPIKHSETHTAVAEIDSTMLDFTPYTLTLDTDSLYKTVSFMGDNDYSYNGVTSQ